MWNTRIFLVALLLVKVNGRPDGYGVKGGRVHKATANAVASAHATAHADASSFGAAKSSASAIASASSNGDGVSNASASADASIGGGNIEEGERGGKENGNANELGDSDDLGESKDRGKATEYKSINHEDGTASWNPRNPDAEHVAPGADDAGSWKAEGTHEETDCSPKGVKGHRGTGLAGSRCKNSQPGAQVPGENKEPGVSADWQHPTEENGGKGSKSGTIDRGHAASPCTPGDSKCLTPKSDTSEHQPSPGTHPKFPDHSSKPPGTQNSYGQNAEKPESYSGGPCESPCANGGSKCPTHPGLPASSLEPPAIGNAHHAGIDGSHSPNPCSPGDSKCFMQNPTVLSPYPTSQQHPDSPFGTSTPSESKKPGMIDRSYAGSPCGSPGSTCFMGQTPTAPKAENTDAFSTSEPHSKPGQHEKPESQAAGPCAADPKCGSHKPTVSEHHSEDSQHSIEIGSQYGGQSQKPGTMNPTYSRNPCAPDDSKCSAHKPSVSYPSPSYVNQPDSSSGSSGNADHGYGGSSQQPGTIGGPGYRAPGPCGPLDWKCLSQEPIVPKPQSTYDKNPYLSPGSHPLMGSGSGNEGQTPEPQGGSHSGNACSPGDWKCSAQKPSGPNSYPTLNPNPWTPTDEDHSSEESSESESDDGSQWSSGNQPGSSNPFLNGEIDVSGIKSSSNSGAQSGGQINHSNPFLNPNYQPHSPTSTNHPGGSNGNNGSPVAAYQPHPQTGSSGNSEHPHVKPNPTNPFFHSNGQVHPTSGVKHPETTGGTQTTAGNKFPSSQGYPGGLPTTGCHGSASCEPSKPSGLSPIIPEYPHNQSPPGAGHHETKPSPPNPFFSGSGHPDKPKDSKHPDDQKIPHPQTEANQPPKPINDCYGIASCYMTPPPGGPPKNPFFTNHGPESGTHGVSAGHKPTQHPALKPETGGSVPNPFFGHDKDSSNDGTLQTAHGKGSGTSSHDCNTHDGPFDQDSNKSPSTEGFEMDRNPNHHGVKGHRSGVKGGSRGPPMRLQGSLGLGASGLNGPGHGPTAESSAVASAGAFSQASASSSSSSAGGQSSASAKSEAYSRIQSDDGLSGSWAASHAHASASASSWSSSDPNHDQGGSTIPGVSIQ